MAACRLEYFSLVFLSLRLFSSYIASASSIRGVAVTRLPFYDSSKDFTCLDGSLTVPFNNVNDDFCDCGDGTDEPGTSACSNGLYHCTNAGFRPRNIPSSRVNDGLCDCCDGSDEYDGAVTCPNTCKELYKELYQKQREEAELAKQGIAIKQDYSQQGQEKKEERKQKLEGLKKQLEEKKAVVESLKAKKDEVETIEKEAKDMHEKEWEETKAKLLAERDRASADTAFRALDTDENGRVTLQEIVDTELLDKKYNEDEARELLGGYEESDIEDFFSGLWSTFKDKYLHKQPEPTPVGEENPTEAETPPTESPPLPPPIDDNFDDEDLPEVPGDEDDDEEEEDEDERDEPSDEFKQEAENKVTKVSTEESNKDDDLKMPEYDEETKAKISVADDARKEFNDAETVSRETEKEISELERSLNLNLGQEEEFSPLQGQCFDYTDREYLYKLCPFDRASQQPKDGGSETSLGTWGEWTGEPNKYSRMKYSGGQACWNGPSRSATINLRCGSTNEVVQVSEPSRCEYHMEFRTPAACQSGDGDSTLPHGHGGEL
ncbi:hypothetical protein OS493_025068 [Desmophyllum pertusum]|uniref:Glucosidase 2 subunit beta n=1 Tax=Desmophyllum pertusum TaxID=174260 RepID=A0A9X0CFM6_9CNID|nr:hypothetical protein OS493_025068 [Desmophyllum pertusum]